MSRRTGDYKEGTLGSLDLLVQQPAYNVFLYGCSMANAVIYCANYAFFTFLERSIDFQSFFSSNAFLKDDWQTGHFSWMLSFLVHFFRLFKMSYFSIFHVPLHLYLLSSTLSASAQSVNMDSSFFQGYFTVLHWYVFSRFSCWIFSIVPGKIVNYFLAQTSS